MLRLVWKVLVLVSRLAATVATAIDKLERRRMADLAGKILGTDVSELSVITMIIAGNPQRLITVRHAIGVNLLGQKQMDLLGDVTEGKARHVVTSVVAETADGAFSVEIPLDVIADIYLQMGRRKAVIALAAEILAEYESNRDGES